MTAIKDYRMFAFRLLAVAVVFAATSAHAQFSVLYNFGSHSGDPLEPQGVVAQGFDGSLYGTSNIGGANALGTVFKITPAGELRVLYSFCSQANCADGETPRSGLSLRPDGHFLGTTSPPNGAGTIFDISETGSLTTLYSFTGGTDGGGPNAPPILGPDGSFYGTAFVGGVGNCGTLYKITTNGTKAVFTVLHKFNPSQGCNPTPLALGADGNLYGTTVRGGAFGLGVVFKVTLRPGKAALVNVQYTFDGTAGTNPTGPPTESGDGNFYGTTSGNGTSGDFGEIFKITPTGTLTVLHNLNGTTDGKSIALGVVQATDGNFYGATGEGGNVNICFPNGCGTLFQVTPAGSFSVLHTFDFATGSFGEAIFQHSNGLLYGTTVNGGTGNSCSCGVFYSWNGSLPPFVSTVPFMGAAGHFVAILGQGLDSSTTVSFNGTPATATVVSGTYLKTTVPAGATTGFITVTTSSGTLTSNRQFIVTP